MTLYKMITCCVVVLMLAACDVSPPDIPYAALDDTSVVDPDNPRKTLYIDFAELEYQSPLSAQDLEKITPENIQKLSQEQIDQIYARLTAGPIPNGSYRGDLFFPNGEEDGEARLAEIIGGLPGRLVDMKINFTELLGKAMWKGKVFYRDQRVLRNQIENLKSLGPLLGDADKDGISTMEVTRRGWWGKFLPKSTVWLLFPAKLYCGQSLLDGRRESVIIDYAYTDDIEGYREKPDSLASRNALGIRDEIRMVRPGFYLGRAYSNRKFLLNFTLISDELDQGTGQIVEDCWSGEQLRTAAE